MSEKIIQGLVNTAGGVPGKDPKVPRACTGPSASCIGSACLLRKAQNVWEEPCTGGAEVAYSPPGEPKSGAQGLPSGYSAPVTCDSKCMAELGDTRNVYGVEWWMAVWSFVRVGRRECPAVARKIACRLVRRGDRNMQ